MDYNTARDRLIVETVAIGQDEAKRKMEGVAAATDKVTVASEKQERAIRTTASGFERMMAQIDKTVAAEQKHIRQMEQINRYLSEGTINGTQYGRALDLINRRHTETIAAAQKAAVANDNFTKTAGLARHEMLNFGRQLSDVGTQLAGGQSPFLILAQQGPQVLDIFAASNASAKGFAQQLLAMVTPARVLGATLVGGAIAATAAWAAFASQQKELDASLTGLGRGTGTTRAGLNSIAEGVGGNISTSAARDLVGGFAATGRIDPSIMGRAAGMTRNLSLQLGVDLSEAGGIMTKALADPVKGAEDLNAKLGILDGRTREYIRTAVSFNDRTSAQDALLKALAPTIADAEKRVTAFGRAWNYTWNQISGAADAVGKVIAGTAGLTAGQQLDSLLRQRADAVRASQAPAPGQPTFVPGLGYFHQTPRGAPTAQSQATGDIARIDAEIEKYRRQAENELWMARRQAAEEAARIKSLEVETVQKLTAEAELAVKAIGAVTLSERAAIAADQARMQALHSGQSALMASTQAEIERNKVLAEAARQAREAVRDSNQQAALIGLKPYERRLREIQFEEQRNRERFGGGVSAAPVAAGSRVSGLDEGFGAKVRALITAVEQAGGTTTITSGFRSTERQAELYQQYGPGRAARPGSSQHERGLAVDIVTSDPSALREAAARLGLRVLPSNGGAWHVDAGLGARGGGGVPGGGGDPAATIASNARRAAYDAAFSEPIRQAQRDVDELRTANDNLSRSFGQSAQQIDEVNNLTRLLNQARRESNGEINPKYIADAEKVAKAMAEQQERQRQLNRQFEEQRRLVGDLQGAFSGALGGFLSDLLEGKKASEALGNAIKRLAADLTQMAANMAIRALFQGLFGSLAGGSGGGLLGGLFKPSAYGNAFLGGNVIPFANGGVVTGPTIFPMARGMGLMGEAGPEAVMPLQRAPDGRLGVVANDRGGGNVVNFSVNVQNNNGSQVRVEKRDDGNGGVAADVIVGEMVGAALERPGSPANRSIESRGAKRALTHY